MTEFPAQPDEPNVKNVLPFDIFKRLREETAEIHHQTEKRMPVFRDDFGLNDYINLLERFYGFWSPVEDKLSNLISLQAEPELDLPSRLKSTLLRADLITLNRNPSCVRQCTDLPTLIDFWQGLGCLYVSEGSTLGSRLIAPHLVKTLNLREDSGAAFFNAYGPSVTQRWKDFRAFVARRANVEHADAVVSAARHTFTCFYDWLGPSR